MKAAILTMLALITVFASAWTFRAYTPVSERTDTTPWWASMGNIEVITPLAGWQLNPEIPGNYIPVLGENELYMVVDESGNIIRYMHRVQQPDGTWVWHTVNPDIPVHYELVEGTTDLYRVTDENGNVRYFRYHRNADDTFWFEETDANGNPVKSYIPQDGSIPDNFIRVTGNIYAVYNEHGVIIGYYERVQNADGSYSWVEADEPPAPERRMGTPYANPGNSGGSNNSSPQNNNFYDLTEYLEQLLRSTGGGPANNPAYTGMPPVIIESSGVKTEPQMDGSYIEIETYTETRTSGNWTIIEETTVTREYSPDGILKTTRKDGPREINRYETVPGAGTRVPDRNLIAPTLGAELKRLTDELPSLKFDTALADSVLELLNERRVAEGVSPLKMADGELMAIAQIKAMDMALFNHGDYDSPMYGTAEQLMGRYGMLLSVPSETLWRTTGKTADQIHSRFHTQDGLRVIRMADHYKQVAIAIVGYNGYQYIAEIYND